MIDNIATAAVYVSDQKEAERFWVERVGFEVRKRQSMGPDGDWLEVAPSGAQSRLVVFPRAMMPDWAERRPSIVFECSDVQAAYDRMSAAGVEFTEEPQQMPWGTYVNFRDPDGNEYVLNQV